MAYPPPAPYPQPMPTPQGNGFGVTGLVTGIIGAVFAFIPVVNVFIAVPLGIIAIIFGIIGLVKAGSRGGKGKGTGGTGLVLGLIAVIGTFAINVMVFNAASDYVDEEWQKACDEAGLTDEECGDWDDWETDFETP
ncbi:hypothetical protein [Glycomyces paridis]|uniref:DUF4190 domain-containing protein n=1 Tax=Glycomyces paridis TaxID=2126555 RepID=A0A4S8PMR8_9ACTN|nr:hypothetical protein [Glycomyces paridis]THV32067.1 hypothetical protein E9998_01025 [Glycomyces paridis]